MSGGKSGVETVNFLPAIGTAAIAGVLAIGTHAYVNTQEAIHYQKLIKAEEDKQKSYKREQESLYKKEYKQYQENLKRKYAINTNVSTEGLNIKLYKERIEEPLEKYQTIWKMCQEALEMNIPIGKEMGEMLTVAKKAINTADLTTLDSLIAAAEKLLPKANQEIKEMEALKEEYIKAVARVKALHEIFGMDFIPPRIDYYNAESVIRALNDTSDRLIAEIEKIEQDPSLNMSEEEKNIAQNKVADKITTALHQNGIDIVKKGVLGNSKVMFYSYKGALLRVSVSTTGIISMQIVGEEYKESDEKYKQTILEAMETFKKDFPDIQDSMLREGVGFQLTESVEPSEDIITYDDLYANSMYIFSHDNNGNARVIR